MSDEYERRYMDPGERLLFREKVVSRIAFRVCVAFAVTFGLLGLVFLCSGVVGGGAILPGVIVGASSIAFAALMGVLGVMFSVFRVMVTGSHLHVHFGWVKKKIPLAAISVARVVRLQGLKQGKVSLGFDGVVRTWVGNAASGRGVEITYEVEGARKNILTIGSDDPERFIETIESARSAAATDGKTRVLIEDDAVDSKRKEEDTTERKEDTTEEARERRDVQ